MATSTAHPRTSKRARQDGPLSRETVIAARQRARNYRARARAADLMGILCWVSVALSVSLYLAYSGSSQFTSPGGFITAAGIITGLAGTDLILLMLLLAARVPWIDKTVGQDRAIALHKKLGKPALYLILGHGLLLTVGYSITDGSNVIAETISFFGLGNDLLLAYISTGLLLGVVVTSVVAVRRHFAYEAWHVIHLLSYVAVLTALPHQLSIGGVLADGTLQRIYWIGLYVTAFGAIAVFRFAVPIIRTLRHRMRVERIEKIAPGVVSIQLAGADLRRLGAEGGQYAIWRFWSRRTWWHAHPISFSAMPTDRTVRITVRELGRGTSRLTRLRTGTFVSIEGPYGIFTDQARTSPYLTVIAAGIGVTPIRAMLEHAKLRPGEASILLRGSDGSQQYLWQEIGQIAKNTNASAFSMLGPRPRNYPTWMSAHALANNITLESTFPHLHESDLFICGPAAWANEVLADARDAGLPEKQIHIERFDT
ncbi:ferric reductase-like transmembrane domain-containing protein [Subtercola vilae]|uniref:Oxidoreductase n=1 Tax=Subtercola vilae TaxID=2056433 RepID=A0A4V4RFH6_9MICO|nr:ferric reductase-like transmembrane domain-containing protein [Subtercola vilae]TIH36164.1 oxidoreductase [Subtercola vilae]